MQKLIQYVAVLFLSLFAVAGCQSVAPETLMPIRNPGFDGPVINQILPGWEYEEHAGPWGGRAYEVATESGGGPGNTGALRVTQIHVEHYSFVHQKIRVRPEDAGKTIRFSAILKSDNVGPKGWTLVVKMIGGSGMVAMVSSGGILDAFGSTPVVGTSNWNNSFVTGVIPVGTTDIDVGFSLADSGTGWAAQPKLVIE